MCIVYAIDILYTLIYNTVLITLRIDECPRVILKKKKSNRQQGEDHLHRQWVCLVTHMKGI